MSITASMVSELRTKTGAGMMDCKKALTEAGGEMEKAVELLRKKGLSAAAKKSGRAAAEGMIVAAASGNRGVLVEVNSETDFVSKNDQFVQFTNTVAQVALENGPADVEALKALPYPGGDRSVSEELTALIATIGENMDVRRYAMLEVPAGVVISYIHAGGKIGSMVQLATEKGDDERTCALARQLAMHVAAASPQFLERNQVSAEVVAKEKEIMAAKAKDSGKPENIIEKIVLGQINKFYGEVCLLEQAYVIDPDQKVNKVVQAVAKDLGADVELVGFTRLALGEGVEKKEEDFAAEVASLTK